MTTNNCLSSDAFVLCVPAQGPSLAFLSNLIRSQSSRPESSCFRAESKYTGGRAHRPRLCGAPQGLDEDGARAGGRSASGGGESFGRAGVSRSAEALGRASRKVGPGPDSKAQRTVGADARKRFCPRAAALRRGGGRERARPSARSPAGQAGRGRGAGALCGPSPRGAGSGRGRGGAGVGLGPPPAWLRSRPSCCAGTCRTAEVWAARGAARPAVPA